MRVPKYRLHKPSGRAVVESLALFGEQRRVYLPGAYGSPESKAAYAALCERVARNEAASTSLDAHAKQQHVTTVGVLFDAYLPWAEGRYGRSQSSEFWHMLYVWRIIAKTFAMTRCADFGPLALKQCRELMIARGWSRQHTNHQVNRLRRVFRWGVSHELVDVAVLAALREVPGLRRDESSARESEKVEPVLPLQVATLLPFLLPITAAMVRVQYFSGMRSGELTAMQGEHLERWSGVWIYRPPKHKTAWRGMNRTVFLGPNAIEELKQYDTPAGYLFSPAIALREQKAARQANRRRSQYGLRKANQSDRATHGRYTSRSYYKAIQQAIARAEAAGFIVPHWHPHQLRHTKSTMVRARYGIEGAQASLGNTLEATEIYAQRSLELAERIARETG